MIALWIILGVVALILIYLGATYNKLVSLRNKVKDQWSQIEVVLKRRADLIPNLVETVKGYAKHEQETLDAVISARAKAVSATTTNDAVAAEGELSQALGRLMAISESYPELKANENFLGLQNDLKDTEDKITYSRQFYNDSVLRYQNAIEKFPSNIVASIFGFKPYKFFEASEEDKKTPEVKF